MIKREMIKIAQKRPGWAKDRKKYLEEDTMFGGKGSEVHHIKHYAKGGSNKSSNLIALPPSVHKEIHKGERAGEKHSGKLRKWKKNPFG